MVSKTARAYVTALLALGVLSGCSSSQNAGAPAAAESSASGGVKVTSEPVQIQRDFQDGDLGIRVNVIQCGLSGTSYQDYDSDGNDLGNREFTATGQFCLVNVELTNTGSQVLTVSLEDQGLIDGEGTLHRPLEGTVATFIMDDLKALKPGVMRAFDLVFDLDLDATIRSVELRTSSASAGVSVLLPSP